LLLLIAAALIAFVACDGADPAPDASPANLCNQFGECRPDAGPPARSER